MRVLILKQCDNEIIGLPEKARISLRGILIALSKNQQLTKKCFKKLSGTNLYEARFEGNKKTYRAIGKISKNDFILARVFCKKSSKTPKRELNITHRRINNISKNYEKILTNNKHPFTTLSELDKLLYPDAKKRTAYLQAAKTEARRLEAEYRKELSHKLKSARVKAQISQSELARRLGTHKTAISRIESGRQNITMGTLVRTCHAIGRPCKIDVRIL